VSVNLRGSTLRRVTASVRIGSGIAEALFLVAAARARTRSVRRGRAPSVSHCVQMRWQLRFVCYSGRLHPPQYLALPAHTFSI